MTGAPRILIACAGLRRTYGSPGGSLPEVEVLRGVDLEIREGEILTIGGASGSGKSTLLNILGGLDRPTAGEVRWEGRPVSKMDDEERAAARGRFVGFVFQFHHLLHEFTALENVMLPAMITGAGERDAAARAEALLAEVGLTGRKDHRPAELSGGEQQRVAVARALVNDPAVVLADEPSGNLDSENGARLMELFGRLHAARRQSFVIVTHNPAFAPRAGRSFTMVDGVLVRDTPA